MDNKNDWKELQEWENKKREDEYDKYGLNISNIDIKKQRKSVNKVIGFIHTLNISTILIFVFLIFIIVSIIGVGLSNFEFMTINSKLEKEMKERYNLDVTIWNKVKYESEEYYKFQMYANDVEKIEFTAIYKNNKVTDDYKERKLKYYFDLWRDEQKDKFKVKESEHNNMLSYEIFIDNIDKIEEATNIIMKFADFCEEKYIYDWNVYLVKNNKKIFPYQSTDKNNRMS